MLLFISRIFSDSRIAAKYVLFIQLCVDRRWIRQAGISVAALTQILFFYRHTLILLQTPGLE